MKIFNRHLFLFDNPDNINYLDLNSNSNSLFRHKDIIIYVSMLDGHIEYNFAVADTDFNAISSFYREQKFNEHYLLAVFRENEINKIIQSNEFFFYYDRVNKEYLLTNELSENDYSLISHLKTEQISQIKSIYEEIKNIKINADNLDIFQNIRTLYPNKIFNEEDIKKYLNEYEVLYTELEDFLISKDYYNMSESEIKSYANGFLIKIENVFETYSSYNNELFLNIINSQYHYLEQVCLNRIEANTKEKLQNYFNTLHEIIAFHVQAYPQYKEKFQLLLSKI